METKAQLRARILVLERQVLDLTAKEGEARGKAEALDAGVQAVLKTKEVERLTARVAELEAEVTRCLVRSTTPPAILNGPR